MEKSKKALKPADYVHLHNHTQYSLLDGLTKVPAIIRDANDQEKLEVALVENIQRENLNPIDLAYAYQKLMSDYKLTQEEVAKRVGKSRSSVANTVRFIGLPEEVRLAMIDGKINEGHAKYIIGLEKTAIEGFS